MAISWMRSLKRVTVVDPSPNPTMLDILGKIAPHVQLLLNGPLG